ncbi:MAG TPA: metalloprotease TldD [Gammaproteobacteria bacterium]|nr:metalloprotease TldD [Gammaproteobacteria bacterium]
MNPSIKIAHDALLSPSGLTENSLDNILGKLLGKNIDYADLYLQTAHHESWLLEDSLVKHGSFNIDCGMGLRAISGEKTGFAYSDDLQLTALEQAAGAARSIAQQGGYQRVLSHSSVVNKQLYGLLNPLGTLSEQEKLQLLHQVDAEARRLDPRVVQVNANLAGSYEVILIIGSDGTYNADVRPLVRLNVSVIVENQGRREQGFAGGGGRLGYACFTENQTALEYAREAVRLALVNLEAKDAPAGEFPVVLGSGWPGVLLHEAVGHGLEGDFNRRETSVFSGRIGERVAAPGCTVVDDGTLPGRRGSLNIDDEGTPTQKNILIENGILKGYLQDKHNARLMGGVSTGNGRRESYAHLPMPRMTNTYMLPGNYLPEEIIASVEKGIYAVNFAGGQVDITSGKFVFTTSEAYMIENGKIAYPVKGATLIGNGPDVLTRVSMVGNDLKLDSGIGVCGKEGQSVPVGVGQPTLRVDALTVGGTR